MNSFIEIEFKGFRREKYHNPEEYPFKRGEYAVVEADKGIDLGMVHQIKQSLNGQKTTELKKILRKAVNEDLNRLEENRKTEGRALIVCREKVLKHKLPMKILDTEYQFDKNKFTFYFTADGRIDFRELVKDLASEYKTRIELRQIGARDDAKRTGGYGMCGIQKCCTTCITEFTPITTQLAKEQNLALNPLKLSGVCGKLKCCLLYEKEFYKDAKRKFPDVDTKIITEKGPGKVQKIDIFNEAVQIRFEDDTVEKMSLIDVMKLLSEQS